MPADRIALLELWYAGFRARIGVKVKTGGNADSLRHELYIVRREAHDPDLETMSITRSPDNPTGELWIVHKSITIEVPDEEIDADVENKA